MAEETKKKKDYEIVSDFQLTSFSLVSRCPYCGAKFGEAGTTNDGKPCTHPTKMTNGMRGFTSMEGRRRG